MATKTKKSPTKVVTEDPAPVAMTTRDQVKAGLMSIELIPSPTRDNAGAVLHEIFIWQEVCKAAEAKKEAAWKKAADMVPDDDEMRALGAGDHTIVSTQSYVLTACVNKPGKQLSTEALMLAIARRYNVPMEDLQALAETCKVPKKAALSKKVVEG